MLTIEKRNMIKLKLAGLLVGLVGSYLWVYNPQCTIGGCPLTSNIYFTLIWGAMMGYWLGGLIFDLVIRKK
jgi:hypothetical protein